MQIWEYTLEELSAALQKGALRSQEVTQAFLERIAALNGSLNAYITVNEEKALAAAAAADLRLSKGAALSPLDGVPMALADVFCTEGIRTTCGSRMLEDFIPPYDATAWKKLAQAGAVLLGKTNVDEFALGSSTESSYFGPSRNPYDLNRVPGGASGGSAAALAAGLAGYALGTDAGGAVRQPAAFCGVVGLKPTYGRISRYGVVSAASSLDQAGIFGKTPGDCALILSLLAGEDEYDATSAPLPVGDYAAACQEPIKGLKIGIPREFLSQGIGAGILKGVEQAAANLAEQGAEIVEVSLPHTKYALATHTILAAAEGSSNLARYDGIRYGFRVEKENLESTFVATRSEGFGTGIKSRIMLGTHFLSAASYEDYYHKALRVRTLIRQDYDQVFQTVDCLLSPVTPDTAFKLGERRGDAPLGHEQDACTIPANLAGLPALSVPYGLLEGLPLGLQLMAAPFEEGRLLQIGQALANGAAPLPRPKLPLEAAPQEVQ